jgi:hypothetical protein
LLLLAPDIAALRFQNEHRQGVTEASRLADDLTLVEDRLRNAVLRPAQVEQLERFPNPLKFPNVRDDSRRPVMRG